MAVELGRDQDIVDQIIQPECFLQGHLQELLLFLFIKMITLQGLEVEP